MKIILKILKVLVIFLIITLFIYFRIKTDQCIIQPPTISRWIISEPLCY